MAEIIPIAEYFRTCENCVWGIPRNTKLLEDQKCGHPGGWTPRWIGRHPYARLECNEFERKRRENHVTV